MVVVQGHSREPTRAKKADKFEAAAYQLDEWIHDAGSETVLLAT